MEETIYDVLGDRARHMSAANLSWLVAASMLAAMSARWFFSWLILSGCAAVACFGAWGLVFSHQDKMKRTVLAHTCEWSLVGLGSLAGVAFAFGLYSLAMGGPWVL